MSDRLLNLSHVNHARSGHSVVIGEARYAPGGDADSPQHPVLVG